MLTRLAVALAAALLLTGCTGGSPDPDVARTDAPPSGATPIPGTGAETEPEPAPGSTTLEFGGGNVGTVPGCRPARTYLAAYQPLEVLREVRLGEPAVDGAGRLVGQVFLLPAPKRGPGNRGFISIANKPSTGVVRGLDGWQRRVPLEGRLVQPGEYAVFLQLEARPGRPVEGVSFSWFDSSATGSDLLELGLRYARRCGG